MSDIHWPSPRPRNFATVMEKHRMIVRPPGLIRWTHDAAIAALAEYLHLTREEFLTVDPVTFIAMTPECGLYAQLPSHITHNQPIIMLPTYIKSTMFNHSHMV